jgi:hypothetical protein
MIANILLYCVYSAALMTIKTKTVMYPTLKHHK